MSPVEAELRNVEWELYLLYRGGETKSERIDKLWREVDRLDAILALEG